MDFFLTILLISILVVAAVIDIKVQKIPNLLTFPTMIVSLIYYGVTAGWEGVLFSLEGLAIGIAVFLVPYLMGGMGAGDAKLMGAVGAITGSKGVLIAALFSAIIGGVYALIILFFNIQYFKDLLKRGSITIKSFVLTRQFISVPSAETINKPKICFGVAIAIGTFSYVFLDYYGYSPV